MNLRCLTKPVLLTALSLSIVGCHHKQRVATVSVPVPPPTQVPLAPTPEPTTPPQVAQVPETPTPLPTKVPKVKKPRKKADPAVSPSPAPAPVQVASAAPPPDLSVVGRLTAGGESAPAEKQRAADLIGSVERRLGELPTSTRDAQHDGLLRVRDFLNKAREALKTGDAGGASTLATKAQLLLDDLLK